jgi:hypothetical protein
VSVTTSVACRDQTWELSLHTARSEGWWGVTTLRINPAIYIKQPYFTFIITGRIEKYENDNLDLVFVLKHPQTAVPNRVTWTWREGAVICYLNNYVENTINFSFMKLAILHHSVRSSCEVLSVNFETHAIFYHDMSIVSRRNNLWRRCGQIK